MKSPFARETLSMIVLRWLSIIVVVPFLVFGGFSAYRAWVQVKSLALRVSEPVLHHGSTVTVDAESWARTYVTVRVMLEQGTRSDTLLVHRITANHVASLDPRSRSARHAVVLTRARLAPFAPGTARLRAIAIGGPQWLRTPPPLVRELTVTIAPERGVVPSSASR